MWKLLVWWWKDLQKPQLPEGVDLRLADTKWEVVQGAGRGGDMKGSTKQRVGERERDYYEKRGE